MKRIGSFPVQLLITALLSTVFAFAIPVFVDRHEYAKAVVDHVKNPNSENDATLKAERAKNQRVVLRADLVAAGVLFALWVAKKIWVVLRNLGVARLWFQGSDPPSFGWHSLARPIRIT